ncbi:MAG: hypothetical protein ACR2LK_09110 [Solirubrobacteraceae bacterium]
MSTTDDIRTRLAQRLPDATTYYSAVLEFTTQTAPHEIAFESFGSELVVCASSAEILARIKSLLPPGWRPCKQTLTQLRLGIVTENDGTHSIYQGSTRVSEGQGLELSLMVLDSRLRGYVALNATGRTFVHAGAVGHEGLAIVIPGHSFAGKTTLVAALVRAGATYYSDEFAVFDDDGMVYPYAKPLSIRPGPNTPQVETDVGQLGGRTGKTALPLALAVFTHYRPGCDWQPKRISSGQAALALLGHTVSVRSRPDSALRAISRALDNAVALDGDRGEADEVAHRLLETAQSAGAQMP